MAVVHAQMFKPPLDLTCVICSTPFSSETVAINEIHIYSASNEFERSITILDALVEVFGTPELQIAKSLNVSTLTCSNCAEIVSFVFKHFLNLTAVCSPYAYVCQLIKHIGRRPFHPDIANPIPASSTSLPLFENVGESAENGDVSLGETRDASALEFGGVVAKSEETGATNTDDGNVNEASNPRKGYNPRLFECHHTGCNFSAENNFKVFEHLLSTHANKKPYQCKCGFTFYEEVYKVESHRCRRPAISKMPMSTDLYPCEICGGTFRGKKMLAYHVENDHVVDEIKFACLKPDCKRRFDTRRRLLFHHELHHYTHHHLCNECGRTFKLRTSLMKHLKTHRLSTEEKAQLNEKHINRTKGPLGIYACELCDKIFKRKMYLREHIKFKHEPNWEHKCPICQKQLCNRSKLESHMRGHCIQQDENLDESSKASKNPACLINSRMFQCSICTKKFKYKAFLITHEKLVHPSDTVNALRPAKMPDNFDDRKYLANDIASAGSNTGYDVTVGSKFEEAPELDLNLETIHDHEILKAESSLISVPNEFDAAHLSLNLPAKLKPEPRHQWKCDECEKSFGSVNSLKEHYKSHTGETDQLGLTPKTFPCVVSGCDKVFTRKDGLRRHEKSHHEKDGGKVRREGRIVSHAMKPKSSVLDRRKLQCPICRKLVTDKYYLRKHIMSHSGAHKTISCQLCSYKTSTRTLLRGHFIAHHPDAIPEEERDQWKCEICAKVFVSGKGLREHRSLVHQGGLPFPCSVHSCAMKFRSKTTLESHVFVNHPETLRQEELTRWKCNLCQKLCTNRRNLNEHKRGHRKTQLKFQCELCGVTFRYDSSLAKHMKTKHDNQQPQPSKLPQGRRRTTTSNEAVIRIKKKAVDDIWSSSTSDNEREEHSKSLDLGRFWSCSICRRSYSYARGISKKDHMKMKHPKSEVCEKPAQKLNFYVPMDCDKSDTNLKLKYGLAKEAVVNIERVDRIFDRGLTEVESGYAS